MSDRGKRFGPDDFQAATHANATVMARLTRYAALLEKWQKAVNLVGPKTLPDLWRRHMLDSAQIWPLLGPARRLVDLGSGAGFPGLVLALMGVPEVHLYESDQRKCAFLREVARETGIEVKIHSQRIESAEFFEADAITARALAPLPDLLSLARPFCGQNTRLIFLKGQDVDDELTKATKYRKFSLQRQASQTDPAGSVLIITGLDQ